MTSFALRQDKSHSQSSFAPTGSALLQRKCGCGSGGAGLAGKCDECQKSRLSGEGSSSGKTTLLAKLTSSSRAYAASLRENEPMAQPKLTVSQPGDQHEEEADRVADRIMRSPQPSESAEIPESSSQRQTAHDWRPATTRPQELKLQRKRLDEDDELKGKWNGSPGQVTPDVAAQIRGLSGGQPLPTSERSFFKPWFGHSFEDVRVHADSQANAAAHAVNARAFTLGNDIVFGSGQYSPGTHPGRRLLAHELTHVVQQRSQPATTVQRDLATPPLATKAPKKAALTQVEIDAAMEFNKARYDERNTREIQDLVGSKPTGIWAEKDIKMIALLQEEFGLTKDGMVDSVTFKFLDNEVRLEKLSKTDEKHCLLSFSVATDPPVVGPVTGGSRSITAKFTMSARFSEHCGCSEYEFRQYIRGHWKRERGGVVTDLGHTFTTEPAGRLNETFDEDGNTSTAALNYGHRDQAAEAGNQYLEADHATGCIYEGEDNPGGPDAVMSGDVFDIDVNFRGDIERKGTVVATKSWSAINGRFPVP
jgi:hypothetical protein